MTNVGAVKMLADIQAARKMALDYAEAWSSGSAAAVASFYAEDGQITINKGEAHKGRASIDAMAAGFYAAFPDLIVHCDDIRLSGTHAVFVWTLEGHHAETKNFVKLGGWEEWELDEEGKIKTSLGWFSAADYDAQVEGR